MTRVRRRRDARRRDGVSTSVRAEHLVCADADRTFTIIDVATRQTTSTRANDSDRSDTCQVLTPPRQLQSLGGLNGLFER